MTRFVRSFAVISGLLAVLAAGWWWWSAARGPAGAEAGARPNSETKTGNPPAPREPVSSGTTPAAEVPAGRVAAAATSPASPPPFDLRRLEEEFPIVAPLNRPDSTVARDLDTLAQVFDAWRSNFPRDGNPVGENADITAALTGAFTPGFALIPRNHPAIDAEGRLCDRWGTPFRFHQISGHHMEIRSAGPDRKFATADDAVWHPPE